RAHQQRVLVPLGDDQAIVRCILADYVPRRARMPRASSDSEPSALTDRIEADPLMPADDHPFRRLDRAGDGLNVAAQERSKVALADKADARAVFPVEIIEPGLLGKDAHLGFGVVAERESGAC